MPFRCTLKKGVSVGIGLFVALHRGPAKTPSLCRRHRNAGRHRAASRRISTPQASGALLTLSSACCFTAAFCTRQARQGRYPVSASCSPGSLGIALSAHRPLSVRRRTQWLLFPDSRAWSSYDRLTSKPGLTFGQCFNVSGTEFNLIDFIVIIFAFLFVDLFDTLGTLIGVANKADMLDKDGKLPAHQAGTARRCTRNVRRCYSRHVYHNDLCRKLLRCRRRRQNRSGFDCNRSAVFSFYSVRTGIHNHSELRNRSGSDFCRLPDGSRRNAQINFDLDNLTESIPAYLAIIACMPLTYSISEGICSIGVISYVLHQSVAAGNRKKVAPLMYVLAVLFVPKYIFL